MNNEKKTSRKMSISLQDVSNLDTFLGDINSNVSTSLSDLSNGPNQKPLKANSLSVIHSASSFINIRNINSKKYKHIQSKVKNYIKEIKKTKITKSEDHSDSDLSFIDDQNRNFHNQEFLLSTVNYLKDELHKKDELIDKLQENYNILMQKYIESEIRIDRLRFDSIDNWKKGKKPNLSPNISISDFDLNKEIMFIKNNKNFKCQSLPNVFSCYKEKKEFIEKQDKSIQTEEQQIMRKNSPSNKYLMDCIREIDKIVSDLGIRSDTITQVLSSDHDINQMPFN